MSGFIAADTGAYYEGDRISEADHVVPERPSPLHTWSGAVWVDGPAVINAAILAEIAALETSVTERRKQEAIIGDQDAVAFIKGMRELIADLRLTLVK